MKVGVYIDAENITRNGGRGLRFDILREFACRNQAETLRLNVYTSYDHTRGETDFEYRRSATSFQEALRDFGYKVIVKYVKWYHNEDGKRSGKANSDLDMAVDMLLEARNMDRVVVATGDGDFTKVVRSLQNMGCRVEVVAFDNVSGELKRESDMFLSGYLIPRLLPTKGNNTPWGEEGSRVRGLCYWYDSSKGYGFIRYLNQFQGPLHVVDTQRPDSPYKSVFIHNSELRKAGVNTQDLPSRKVILEFSLKPSPKEGEQGLTAQDVSWVSRRRSNTPQPPKPADQEPENQDGETE